MKFQLFSLFFIIGSFQSIIYAEESPEAKQILLASIKHEAIQPCTSSCATTKASTPKLVNYKFKFNAQSEEIELTAIPRKAAEKTIDFVKKNFMTSIEEAYIPHQFISYIFYNSRQIITGKVFEIGNVAHLSSNNTKEIYKRYSAVVVAIEEADGSIKPYVIDLFSPKELYPLEEWRNNIIFKDSTPSNEEFFTNQFHYNQPILNKNLTQLTEEAREDFTRKASNRGFVIGKY